LELAASHLEDRRVEDLAALQSVRPAEDFTYGDLRGDVRAARVAGCRESSDSVSPGLDHVGWAPRAHATGWLTAGRAARPGRSWTTRGTPATRSSGAGPSWSARGPPARGGSCSAAWSGARCAVGRCRAPWSASTRPTTGVWPHARTRGEEAAGRRRAHAQRVAAQAEPDGAAAPTEVTYAEVYAMIDSLGDVGAALKEAKRDDVPAHRGV